MSRVNVETRALAESRLFNLMKILKWKRSQCIGTLVILWHDSQERLKVQATKEEIQTWVDADDDQEGQKIFAALLKCEYLTHVPDKELYHIRGNGKHVESHILR